MAEAPKAEAPKAEAPKAEAPKVAATQSDSAKVKPARAEQPRTEHQPPELGADGKSHAHGLKQTAPAGSKKQRKSEKKASRAPRTEPSRATSQPKTAPNERNKARKLKRKREKRIAASARHQEVLEMMHPPAAVAAPVDAPSPSASAKVTHVAPRATSEKRKRAPFYRQPWFIGFVILAALAAWAAKVRS